MVFSFNYMLITEFSVIVYPLQLQAQLNKMLKLGLTSQNTHRISTQKDNLVGDV
jgi:hypothetical protein